MMSDCCCADLWDTETPIRSQCKEYCDAVPEEEESNESDN